MLDCVSPGLRYGDSPALPKDAEPDEGLPTPAAVAAAYLDFRKVSIFAGTTEVQKNIISKALLA